MHLDFLQVEKAIWIAYGPPLQPPGEFFFEDHFTVEHSLRPPQSVQAFARVGRIDDYKAMYEELFSQGITLVNSPSEHELAANLEQWYPVLNDLTPESMVFSYAPYSAIISENFEWPVFIRGAVRSANHSRKLSVFNTPMEYDAALPLLRSDPILNKQNIVVRTFERLKIVMDDHSEKVPVAVELRTFWWKQTLVGAGSYWNAGGRYWRRGAEYVIEGAELRQALSVAERAAILLAVPFVIIDVAQREAGDWIVIEANDAQEGGYGGVNRKELWEKIIAIEKAR